jgi:hypothetical protein
VDQQDTLSRCQLNTHTQVFQIPESAKPAASILPPRITSNIIPSRVAILGRVEQYSRNYAKIFQDLTEALRGESTLPIPSILADS